MGAMSQVLGKPQPEEEDDDEEDELVGLAGYGDGPDSSDAEPDSGTEEGGEHRLPRSAPRPERPRPAPPPGPARGQLTWRGSRQAELGGGSGEGRQRSRGEMQNGGARVQAAERGPGSVERTERKRLGRRNARSLPVPGPVPPPRLTPSSPQGPGAWEGRGQPGAPWDLSLLAAVGAGVRCRG